MRSSDRRHLHSVAEIYSQAVRTRDDIDRLLPLDAGPGDPYLRRAERRVMALETVIAACLTYVGLEQGAPGVTDEPLHTDEGLPLPVPGNPSRLRVTSGFDNIGPDPSA